MEDSEGEEHYDPGEVRGGKEGRERERWRQGVRINGNVRVKLKSRGENVVNTR